MILSLTYGAMCFLSHALVAAFGSRLKWFLTSARGQRYLHNTIGAVFVGLGIAMTASARS